MITRRNVLKQLGAGAAAAAIAPRWLAGCGDGGGGSPDAGSPDAGPPDASRPDAFPQVVGITHFVEICMENRSYDHWLGSRKLLGKSVAGDGLTADMANKRQNGDLVKVFPADVMCVLDPPHGWDSAHRQFNDGAMDGFLTEYQADQGVNVPPHVMAYMNPEQIPWTSALVEKATVCDRWFSSVMGPTWPNRMYMHTGQSGGLKTNDLPMGGGGFDWRTVYHGLMEKGLPWAYYWSDLPFAALWKGLNESYIRRIQEFFDDAAAGTLPPVSIIEPAFSGNDDHPPHHPMMGQQFLASVFAALAASPLWNNLLIVITYDEQGGFYDHVPPPKFADDRAEEGFDQAGFRVPTIVAGPYVKQGYVDSTVYEHSTCVKQISTMFGLESLTARDAAAADLSACIDMERLAAGNPAPPPELPEITVDESTIDETCQKTGRRYAGYQKSDLERLADTGYFGKLDARKELPDTLRYVADQLSKRGKGGYRRGR